MAVGSHNFREGRAVLEYGTFPLRNSCTHDLSYLSSNLDASCLLQARLPAQVALFSGSFVEVALNSVVTMQSSIYVASGLVPIGAGSRKHAWITEDLIRLDCTSV